MQRLESHRPPCKKTHPGTRRALGAAVRGGACQAGPVSSPGRGRANPPVQGGCLVLCGGCWGRMPSAPGGLFVGEELLKVTEDPSPPNLESPIFPPLTFLRSWTPRTGRVPGWAGRAQVQDLQSSMRRAGSAPNRRRPEPSECTSGPCRHGVNLSRCSWPGTRPTRLACCCLWTVDLRCCPRKPWDRRPVCPSSATDAFPSPCGLGRRQSDRTRKVLVHAE